MAVFFSFLLAPERAVPLTLDSILGLLKYDILLVDFTDEELGHRWITQFAQGCTASW